MSPPIDDRYLEWLYSQVTAVRNRNPARSYWRLFRQLYSTEFVWIVANDDNRVEDGKILRDDFMNEQGSDGVTDEWLNLGCSMLEMLVAISYRAAFQYDREPVEWFGIFLENLGLKDYTDNNYTDAVERKVAQILEDFIYRNYEADGRGGLFPLKYPKRLKPKYRNQAKVELWDQMSAYILEILENE